MDVGPMHMKLLRRGARIASGDILLSDDMAVRVSEIVALGELRSWGLAEIIDGPFPPGPRRAFPSRISDAGLKWLADHDVDEGTRIVAPPLRA